TGGSNTQHVHAAGGETPAPRCRALARAERQPGIQGAARQAPATARSDPGAAVAEPDREAVAPDTGGRSTPRLHGAGGETPAPRCRALARAERQPGIQGAARQAPPTARSDPGTAVAEPDREAVAPDTGGRSAPRLHGAGGETPAPRCRVIAGAERQSGTAGAAREAAARARPDPGAPVAEPDREAVAPDTGGRSTP